MDRKRDFPDLTRTLGSSLGVQPGSTTRRRGRREATVEYERVLADCKLALLSLPPLALTSAARAGITGNPQSAPANIYEETVGAPIDFEAPLSTVTMLRALTSSAGMVAQRSRTPHEAHVTQFPALDSRIGGPVFGTTLFPSLQPSLRLAEGLGNYPMATAERVQAATLERLEKVRRDELG